MVPYYFDILVSTRSVKDTESRESLEIIRRTLHFDVGHYLNPGSIGDVSVNVINGTYSSLSTALKTIGANGQVAAALDAWLQK